MDLRGAKQLTFEKNKAFKDHLARIEHGGELRKGRRKITRPFSARKSLHLTLRSSKARGAWSFLKSRNENKIQSLLYKYAERFNVRIFRFANAGNHLHILLKAESRRDFQNFLRTISGVIPRVVTGARKGQSTGKFWDALAYSKLINWGRQFKNTSNYILKNTLEAFGIIPPRQNARKCGNLDFQSLLEEWNI